MEAQKKEEKNLNWHYAFACKDKNQPPTNTHTHTHITCISQSLNSFFPWININQWRNAIVDSYMICMAVYSETQREKWKHHLLGVNVVTSKRQHSRLCLHILIYVDLVLGYLKHQQTCTNRFLRENWMGGKLWHSSSFKYSENCCDYFMRQHWIQAERAHCEQKY